MLTISHISAGYGESSILKDVSLELPQGTIAVLMGPNGAGKSTLLRSIFNLTTITEGAIVFGQTDITKLSTYKRIRLGLAFVSQGKINFGTLSVKDNLLLGAHHIADKQQVAKTLARVYEQFPVLETKGSAYAFTLSGGEQQMLAIGRALMGEPKLLLLDEPSLGLSPKLVKELFEKIREIRSVFNTTILIVEHNLKSLLDIADSGFVMVQGEIIARDTCANLKKSPLMKQVFVGAFD